MLLCDVFMYVRSATTDSRWGKFSKHGLYQNDSTIMTDSPVEYVYAYLRNDIFDEISGKSPTLFYSNMHILIVYSNTYFDE